MTASKDGWTFSPSSKTVSEPASDVNFEGTYRAGGLVSDADGSAVSSVRLDFSEGHASVYTDSYGRWTRDGLYGDMTVTPSLPNWTFDPPSRNITWSSDQYNFTRTYTVSGRITDQNGNGLRYAIIRFSGDHYSSYADENGYWSKQGLSGQIRVTPEAVGYSFTPDHVFVDRPSSNVNFTAIPQSTGYSISGRVTDQRGVGIADVLLFLGGGFGTARTGTTGSWSASELSGDVTVTPAKTGLVFTPETVTVSGSSSNLDCVIPSPTHMRCLAKSLTAVMAAALQDIVHLQRRIRQNSKRRIWRLVQVWLVWHGYSHTLDRDGPSCPNPVSSREQAAS